MSIQPQTHETVSTDEQPDRKSMSETASSLAGKIGFVVGVDGDGDAHVHYPAAGAVDVYDVPEDYDVGDYIEGEPVRHQDLEGRPLEHWMAYVADERGWETTTHRAPEGF